MLKYLPADLNKQIRAKITIAILFTFIPVAVSIIPVAIFLGVAMLLPLYIAAAFISILIATMIGIIMDSISPYTVWSDELSALRGNLNCFFNLAAELVAALVIGGISYLLYLVTKSSLITMASVTGIIVIAGIVIVLIGLKSVKKNIETLNTFSK